MFFKRFTVLGLLAIALIAGLSFIPFGEKVGADVYFADQSIVDLSEEEVREIVEAELNEYSTEKVKIGSSTLTLEELGVSYDVDKTLNRLLTQKNTLLASLTKADSSGLEVISGEVVVPVVNYNYGELRMKVSTILDKYEREPVDAAVKWSSDGYYLKESKLGRTIVGKEDLVESIVDELSDDLEDLSSEKTYSVKYVAISPVVKTEQAEVILDQLNEDLEEIVKVKVAGELYEIDVLSSQNWFEFDYENGAYTVSESAIERFVANLAKEFSTEASTVTVKGLKGYTSEYYGNNTYYKADVSGEMKSGKSIDEKVLVADIVAAFAADLPEEKVVNVNFEVKPMTVKSEIAGVSFDDRISIGKSSYALGNGDNRVHNIKTAVGIQNGVVIPPGGRFSFNDVGGWVTYDKGFVDGKVIMGSGVVDAPGGGVCQVSTTSFRAAINAGLDIEKRKNHSWDVSYYQDVYGVDAAIYPPAQVDLAYVNNTPGHILVHAFVNEPEETVYFEFYGQDDGRSVELGEPNLSRPVGRKTVSTDWFVTNADGTVEKREIVSSYWK